MQFILNIAALATTTQLNRIHYFFAHIKLKIGKKYDLYYGRDSKMLIGTVDFLKEQTQTVISFMVQKSPVISYILTANSSSAALAELADAEASPLSNHLSRAAS